MSGDVYEERAATRRWPLLAAGLYGPLAGEVLCVALGVLVSPDWFIAMCFPLFAPLLASISLLYRNWPTGIRVDAAGITVGAVGSRSGGRPSPTVTCQAWGIYHCPWEAVRAVRVATDPAEVRGLRTSRTYTTLNNRWAGPRWMTGVMVGVLTSPFMRAALVVDLDPTAITAPPLRPSRYYTNGKNGRMSTKRQAAVSETWIVPTRQPQRLAEYLRAAR